MVELGGYGGYGGYGGNVGGSQATPDWLRWSSRSTICGGGVDPVAVCMERLGAGVCLLS